MGDVRCGLNSGLFFSSHFLIGGPAFLKEDFRTPRGVGNTSHNLGKPGCHDPAMTEDGKLFAPIKMVMTWGWFMKLGLPHYTKIIVVIHYHLYG